MKWCSQPRGQMKRCYGFQPRSGGRIKPRASARGWLEIDEARRGDRTPCRRRRRNLDLTDRALYFAVAVLFWLFAPALPRDRKYATTARASAADNRYSGIGGFGALPSSLPVIKNVTT